MGVEILLGFLQGFIVKRRIGDLDFSFDLGGGFLAFLRVRDLSCPLYLARLQCVFAFVGIAAVDDLFLDRVVQRVVGRWRRRRRAGDRTLTVDAWRRGMKAPRDP